MTTPVKPAQTALETELHTVFARLTDAFAGFEMTLACKLQMGLSIMHASLDQYSPGPRASLIRSISMSLADEWDELVDGIDRVQARAEALLPQPNAPGSKGLH
jgi:hypothetical protein